MTQESSLNLEMNPEPANDETEEPKIDEPVSNLDPVDSSLLHR
jgi:hypothetical protein